MALKEGRCVNCGSILFLDPKNEKGHCLFCDAVFANSEAFRAQKDPDQFTFPNEPQPPYEGPNLDPRPSAVTVTTPVHMPAAQKKAAVPAFEPTVTHIPDARIPKKAKMLSLGISLLVVAITAAIAIPLLLRRNTQRQIITEGFGGRLTADIDLNKNFSILNTPNNHFILALKESVTEAEADDLFLEYCEARAAAMDIEGDITNGVSMRLVSPEGGYLFAVEDGQKTITPFN